MVHTLMIVSPGLQTGIHAVFVRIHTCACNYGLFDEGLDDLVLHIGYQLDHDLTAALHQPKDGRSCRLHGATATLALESALTALASLAFYARQKPRPTEGTARARTQAASL